MLSLLAQILRTGTPTEPFPAPAASPISRNLADSITALYGGRALRVRHVDAGSNGGEEWEMTALGNAYYDIERTGLTFVASPRHADIMTVSGPVTRNMAQALKTAYELMPAPRIVVAIGDGACTGGIWKDSYAVVGAVENVIPVDFKIPGDPPSPEDILAGLLTVLQKKLS